MLQGNQVAQVTQPLFLHLVNFIGKLGDKNMYPPSSRSLLAKEAGFPTGIHNRIYGQESDFYKKCVVERQRRNS